MRKTLGWLFMSLFMLGCTSEVENATGDAPVGAAESAMVALNAINPNAINPNAINPNAINPNAINPNGLSPTAIPSSALAALKAPGEAGALSRMFMKYLVSCAFNSSQSFSFMWTDEENAVHDETFWGSMAMAPAWETRGLTQSEQRWMTACMAARANFYEHSVLISMRGTHPALGTDEGERDVYDTQEGAFWGDLFAEVPYVKACYNQYNTAHSQLKMRDCATGHWDGQAMVDCANIDSIGPCGPLCVENTELVVVGDGGTAATDIEDGFTSCGGVSEVITVYLD